MFPAFCLTRLNHRFNSMTCETPCENCVCKETVYNSSYQELDSSPLASQQVKYFEDLESKVDGVLRELFLERRADEVLRDLFTE